MSESPIEETLFEALVAEMREQDIEFEIRRHVRPDWCPKALDFQIDGHEFYVECDGYEFHSDQSTFTDDRIISNRALIAGAALMRFSGRMILQDPRGCAALIFDAYLDWNERRCYQETGEECAHGNCWNMRGQRV